MPANRSIKKLRAASPSLCRSYTLRTLCGARDRPAGHSVYWLSQSMHRFAGFSSGAYMTANTIESTSYLVTLSYDLRDPFVFSRQHFFYKIKDADGVPNIQCNSTCWDKPRFYKPEQISAM